MLVSKEPITNKCKKCDYRQGGYGGAAAGILHLDQQELGCARAESAAAVVRYPGTRSRDHDSRRRHGHTRTLEREQVAGFGRYSCMPWRDSYVALLGVL